MTICSNGFSVGIAVRSKVHRLVVYFLNEYNNYNFNIYLFEISDILHDPARRTVIITLVNWD